MNHSTTVKVRFRQSTIEGQPGSIVYAVTRHRTVRTITTEYKIYPCEWDERTSSVKIDDERAEFLLSISNRIKWDVALLHKIIETFEAESSGYSSADVVSKFHSQNQQQSFFHFMESVINRLKQLGKVGTGQNYRTTLNSFSKFRNNEDVVFAEFNADLIEEYEAWLTSDGIKPNSISFYMRILRAVYSRAVAQRITLDNKPFAKAYTGIEKTVKRAIALKDIKRIKELDLSMQPGLEFARDIFLFLFYCRGMSFIDAAYLRETNIVGEDIVYRRHKTNQELVIGINKHIRTIIGHYHVRDSKFILPILTDECDNHRRQYESALRRINNSLKKIAKLAGISTNLTTYVSRHAWATIAKSKGIPTSTISDALGHDSELTTQIYLATISTDAINRANDLILEDL